MNRISYLLFVIFLSIIFCLPSYSMENPLCTQDESWEYIVNNAYRLADDYASAKNPRSNFVTIKKDYTFNFQYGGEYKDSYLLIIKNKHGNDISLCVLAPLFDVNKPSKGLDDTKSLWKIVTAKLNGEEY